jgi:hypothetical protein
LRRLKVSDVKRYLASYRAGYDDKEACVGDDATAHATGRRDESRNEAFKRARLGCLTGSASKTTPELQKFWDSAAAYLHHELPLWGHHAAAGKIEDFKLLRNSFKQAFQPKELVPTSLVMGKRRV